MTERLILQFLRLQNALFYKFLAFWVPYFTVFATPERLILQISRLLNALFYSFCVSRTPYFTNFLPSERLILQFSRFQNALFYKFLALRTPCFTVLASFLMDFQSIIEPFGCLEVVIAGA